MDDFLRHRHLLQAKQAILIMKRTLVDNWSIFLGFLLSFIAITGMFFATFQPFSISIQLPERSGIGALPVPLKPLNQEQANVEDRVREGGRFVYPELKQADQVEEISAQPVALTVDPALEASSFEDMNYSFPSSPEMIHLDPEVPVRLTIESINLDTPIVPSAIDFKKIAGKEYMQWIVPDEFAAGWHTTSALLGEPGNTVLNGHNNTNGEVFKSLDEVEVGDIITIESHASRFSYLITNKMILPEKYEDIDTRMSNAQWILPSVDERLTLISCWPFESNTHRVVIVARPLTREKITSSLE
jgi:LPXTG-site transpeptidase (sortase) family protein